MFKVLIHRKALKEINQLPVEDRKRIFRTIYEMAEAPLSGDVKPIKGIRGLLRRRIGDYRLAFTMNFEEGEVAILRVSRREEFYK